MLASDDDVYTYIRYNLFSIFYSATTPELWIIRRVVRAESTSPAVDVIIWEVLSY